ncbi:MAG: hypothetical protein M1823_004200 [Watsoniomyces obsoletus]|nr:MAG: hypothetical protein M1823_004200 [Watsoniomyces obsoletus]
MKKALQEESNAHNETRLKHAEELAHRLELSKFLELETLRADQMDQELHEVKEKNRELQLALEDAQQKNQELQLALEDAREKDRELQHVREEVKRWRHDNDRVREHCARYKKKAHQRRAQLQQAIQAKTETTNEVLLAAQHQLLDNQIYGLNERLSNLDESLNIEGEIRTGSDSESRPMLMENEGSTDSSEPSSMGDFLLPE